MSIRRSSLICVEYLQVYERVADNRWWPNIGGLYSMHAVDPRKDQNSIMKACNVSCSRNKLKYTATRLLHSLLREYCYKYQQTQLSTILQTQQLQMHVYRISVQ